MLSRRGAPPAHRSDKRNDWDVIGAPLFLTDFTVELIDARELPIIALIG
jgi:hypothetical protein